MSSAARVLTQIRAEVKRRLREKSDLINKPKTKIANNVRKSISFNTRIRLSNFPNRTEVSQILNDINNISNNELFNTSVNLLEDDSEDNFNQILE